MACYVVDTMDALQVFVNEIHTHTLGDDPPPFYIDAEGDKLGRHGTLDILQIHVLPLQETFLIDIYTLQHAAFDIVFGGTSLRTILESPSIIKVFFDVRNDSDALFAHYDISLDGVVDLQMMEYFQVGRDGQRLASLKTCIECDAVTLDDEDIRQWSGVKASILSSFARGAEVKDPPFQQRPLPEEILLYAAGDVEYLPPLYEAYCQRLTEHAWHAVRSETGRRLQQSRRPDYEPQGQHKGMGPFRKSLQTPRPLSSAKSSDTKSRRLAKAKAPVERAGAHDLESGMARRPQRFAENAMIPQQVVQKAVIDNEKSIIAPLRSLMLTDAQSKSCAAEQEVSLTTHSFKISSS